MFVCAVRMHALCILVQVCVGVRGWFLLLLLLFLLLLLLLLLILFFAQKQSSFYFLPKNRVPPVLWYHGTADPLIKLAWAEASFLYLRDVKVIMY